MRALLVEDDPTIAEFVARGLREAGFAVDHEADGEAGLAAATKSPYDAAIVVTIAKNSSELNFCGTASHDLRMLELLIVVVRALTLALRGRRELVLENLALRQQLAALHRTTRCRLRARDRLFWMALARSWRNWRTALIVVQPDTVVRWHRDWLRHRWTRRSQQRHPGRPPIDPQIPALVREMATANPLWGAPRIHGELRMLGIQVSERTVSRLLEPHTRASPQTWKTFLTNHLASAASMDFFTVPTLTGRVLFVVIVLSHLRRRIVHFNITEHPTAEWTAQQVVDAFPDDTAPKWLHRDRDSVYGESFRRRVAGMGIAEVVSAPASPWQNPYAERVIGSIRRECLDHVIVLNDAHLRRVLTVYSRYYHRSRTHLGLEKDAPDPRPVSATSNGPIIAIPEVGG
jgi:transposase InsO family protein